MSNHEQEALISKVTKESLEDIAAKEAVRHNLRMPKQIAGFFAVLAFAAALLPSAAWWLLLPVSVGFALYFWGQLNRLDDLRGRAAKASSRPRRPSGYSDRFARAH